ncbi:hypothetical protein FUAX_35330 [Fulvitalea axinellae]|uniref:Uncharacterized protein n=1 Tax=Fulvitalea axinellae TaxID=1182444 RepID=A0AAU9CPP8_9BACT|nr:hypothetical protein FUAX_35330 [Fulvitalea axinellae]
MSIKRIFFLIALVAVSLSVNAQNKKKPVSHRFLAAGSGWSKIMIVDENGKAVWEHKINKGEECNSATMMPDGNVLYSHKTGATIVSSKNEIVWTYKREPNTEVQSATLLPKGHILIGQNGTPAKLMEFDKNRKLVKTVTINTGVKNPHGQFRRVNKSKQGTYWVGLKGAAREYNAQGELIRTVDTEGKPFTVVPLKKGGVLAGCGDKHMIREYDAEGKEIWNVSEKDLDKGFELRYVADLTRLKNGNTIVANWGGHSHGKSRMPQVYEITPEKKVVWKFEDWTLMDKVSSIQVLDVPARKYFR